MSYTKRQSNIELLRIISMMMVLTVHIDGASLGLPMPADHWCDFTMRDIWRIVVEALAIVGVNCFTMISGYFGIRLSVRGMLKYLFQCVFYAVGLYTLFGVATRFGAPFSLKGWLESWMVLTHTDLWYVPAYFILMLLSPIINAGIDALSKRMLRTVVIILVLFNVWGGWFWGMPFNPTGYTVIQLLMVYILARYIRLHCRQVDDTNRKRVTIFGTTVFALSTLCTAISASVMPYTLAFAYNSPFVLISSVSLFVFFLSLRIQSKFINKIANSAFAVYLIHKNPLIFGNIIKPVSLLVWRSASLTVFTLFAICFVLAIYAVCAVVDIVRQWIENLVLKLLDSSNPHVKIE